RRAGGLVASHCATASAYSAVPHGSGGMGEAPKPGKSKRTDRACCRIAAASGSRLRWVWPQPCAHTSSGASGGESPATSKSANSPPPPVATARPTPSAAGDCAGRPADCSFSSGCMNGQAVSRLGYRMPSRNETSVAVFLGGRSPEHDVSVITGLQALKAIDQDRFVAFPVYVTPRGEWLVGESLSERRSYLPDEIGRAHV